MVKRKKKQLKSKKPLRKNRQQEEVQLESKKLQLETKEKQKDCISVQAITEQVVGPSESISKWDVSNLMVKKNDSLSTHSYRLYCITISNETIGYFGVCQNGYFNHVVIDDSIDSKQVLEFIKTYIRNGLNLKPIEKPRLHSIPVYMAE